MPLYDYRCRACGHCFEALGRVAGTATCPACQSPDTERLLSSFAVRSGGLSNAARRDVRKQGEQTRRDRIAYEREIERKHFEHG